MTEMDAEAFIEQQFDRRGVFYKRLKGDFAIDCPWRPSTSGQLKCCVTLDGSRLHCWSCGKSGNWNTLAAKLGMDPMPGSTQYAYKAIDEAIAKLVVPRKKPTLPPGIQPFEESWRGLEPEFLSRFEAARWFDTRSSVYRILWPIRYNGRLQGWTAGRLDERTSPKYRHGPEGVFRATNALWPIDDESIKRTVVMVEGPYDALRLLRAGIPAVSILGTGAWSKAKLAMLEQRARPVRGIVLAFDGDDEGWHMTQTVYRETRDRFEHVEVFECPEGRDPGNMSDKSVERLRASWRETRARVKRVAAPAEQDLTG